MNCYTRLAAVFLTAMLPFAAAAVELDPVPKQLPADQRAAFTKERAEMLADKKAFNSKLARHNKRCSDPKPYQAHQCSTERLSLFQTVDKYNKNALDFNKRMAALDKGATVNNPATENKSTAADKH